jgi:hypothetical protein
MFQTFVRRYAVIIAVICISVLSQAQSDRAPMNEASRPYKILTSGKQITVKSTKNIKNLMVWTASGHRIVEQKEINNSSYSFNINVNEKIFFLMIEFEGLKPFTEKIGVR